MFRLHHFEFLEYTVNGKLRGKKLEIKNKITYGGYNNPVFATILFNDPQ